MNVDWTMANVGKCLDRLHLTGKAKIKSRDYRSTGRFPVIDQGEAPISGWTDDEAAVIAEPLPVIVFGDHTRILKFIDFPFARGADGTQIMKPKVGIDPVFFYYACRAIDLPARGYNRHFSILKESEIALPPEEEQPVIGKVLRRIEAALIRQSLVITTAQELKRAALRGLFAQGLRGEPQKETEIGLVPESWQVTSLAFCTERPDYGYTASANDRPVGPKLLRITDIQDGAVDWSRVPYCICDSNSIERKRLNSNDIVVARIGATTGKAFLVKDPPNAVFASYLIRIRAIEERVLPEFLHYYMQGESYWRHINRDKDGRLKGGINIPVLNGLAVPLPSPEEQLDIVNVLCAIDCKSDLHRRKRAVLRELFKSLLYNLMSGETRVSDFDLSALDEPLFPETLA